MSESLEFRSFDVEKPLGVWVHLVLHSVDLHEGVAILPDNTPGLVRVGIVADHFRLDHDRRNEKSVTWALERREISPLILGGGRAR